MNEYTYDPSYSYATTSTGVDGFIITVAVLYSLVILGILLVGILALWKTYNKAGYPGWAAVIPIYNWYVLLKIARRPGWWLVLLLVPPAWFMIHLFIALDLAKVFGKDTTFAVLWLYFFPMVGFLILAFDESSYQPDKIGREATNTTTESAATSQ